MSKKKTHLDKAIEQLEGDVIELCRSFDAQRNGLESAISRLRAQQAAKPARKRETAASNANESVTQ